MEAVLGVEVAAAHDASDKDDDDDRRDREPPTYGVFAHLTAAMFDTTLLVNRVAEGQQALLVREFLTGLSAGRGRAGRVITSTGH